MIETYVSVKKVTDYAINVLKYFAVAATGMLVSIIIAVAAWFLTNPICMALAVLGIVASTIALTLGIYTLYIRKSGGR